MSHKNTFLVLREEQNPLNGDRWVLHNDNYAGILTGGKGCSYRLLHTVLSVQHLKIASYLHRTLLEE